MRLSPVFCRSGHICDVSVCVCMMLVLYNYIHIHLVINRYWPHCVGYDFIFYGVCVRVFVYVTMGPGHCIYITMGPAYLYASQWNLHVRIRVHVCVHVHVCVCVHVCVLGMCVYMCMCVDMCGTCVQYVRACVHTWLHIFYLWPPTRLCVCAHMCVWGSIARWPGHRPHNREVVGLIPSWTTFVLLFPWARNLLTLLQSTQLLIWGCGGLVSTREAAHPAITSMDTWEANVKLLSMSC